MDVVQKNNSLVFIIEKHLEVTTLTLRRGVLLEKLLVA
jgi:hypothetical protein